jgi:Fur family ferric uptake transcriptional regulator
VKPRESRNEYMYKLRNHRLKITPRRMAIIELFNKNRQGLSPLEVWSQIKTRFERCGLPSVYRNLEQMVDCGILTRLRGCERGRRYALCTAEGRQHLQRVCIRCGAVETVSGFTLRTGRAGEGFHVLNRFVQLEGLCANCMKS